ncbi:hypothetical protein BSPWISOXPB_2606, partial [uncultured Gammaproteobacteria bacterium]
KIGLVFGLSEYLLGFYWMFSIVEGYDINYQIVMSITILGIITIIALLLGMSSYIVKRLSNNSVFLLCFIYPIYLYAIRMDKVMAVYWLSLVCK